MTDKRNEELIENSETLSEDKKKEMKARLSQEKEINQKDRPASDVYSNVKKDPETGVEIPTDEAVEEAKDWVDNQNRM